MPRPTSTPLAATTSLPDGSAALRLYHLNPRLVGPLAAWPEQLARIAAMGFSGVLLAWPFATAAEDALATTDPDRLHPALGHDGPAADGLRAIAQACRAHGLACLLDLAIDRAATGSPLAAALPGCWRDAAPPWLDPRLPPTAGLRLATPLDTSQRAALLAFWQPRLLAWQASGIAGLRCHAADILPPDLWAALLEPLRSAPGWICIGWMPGQPRPALAEASGTFEYLPSSAAWWDGRAPWLAEEYHALRPLARLLACADDPAGPRLAARLPAAATLGAHRRALHAAAALADGWLLPMGFEFGARLPLLAADASPADFTAMQADAPFDLSDEIAAANAALAAAPPPPALRQLTAPGAAVTLLQRADAGACGHLVALNPGTGHPAAADLAGHAARLGAALDGPARVHLPPGGAAIVPLRPAAPIHAAPHTAPPAGPRLAIEAVTPSVENGRFAAKRIAGDTVVVEADIFTDGHDMIAAELRWRPADSDAWSTTPMLPLGNDRWQAGFPLARPGRHLFAIEAWWDHFATFRRDLVRKRDAGLDLALECQEGRMLLEDTLRHAAPAPRATIAAALAALPAAADPVALLLEDDLAQAMHAADPRPHRTGAETHYPVEADREAAIFASWYELFPRSVTDTPSRHGSFTDVITRLPAIRAMGFDVLYFPPIHPIGRVNRKGPNNTLTPGPDDPGSPYAIGGPEGGHDAIHPELGTREDFRRLVRAAAEHGLEIALDFAIQCAPDHPWLREHPDWFQWRPDGSMKYAENPPKKYQDIVNVDFYGPGAVPGLWLALRDVVQMWVDEGVRIFRVDNPHTKPFPFWEWLIADIRARDPGVLFFAEAFTRPKVMYRLGKIGFSQSYTYFTWRNTKAELTEYLDELNAAPARDLFRPNFFVNTPDINPVFLQTSGRPGFLIRAALAATLSGLWGLYSGFELCEAAALPGREEYLDSEKYQIRVRDYAAPGNIVAEITRLNEIRRGHPALRSHLGLTFRAAGNGQVLFYEKRVPDSADLILVAVSLDPHHAQTTSLELPLWSLGLPDDATVAVEDLMAGQRFTWSGKHQTVTLDPATLPFRVWRIAPQEAPQS